MIFLPNLWAHVLFGQHVLKEMNSLELISRSNLEQLFHFGCQGPDFLLYHNFFPWTKDKRIAQVGDLMHNEHCGVFLLEMLRYVDKYRQGNKQADLLLKDPLVVYSLGFISHYVLDRHVHPYVYYRSGYEQWQHQRFEVMMDTLIVKKLKSLETWKTPAWKQIYCGQQLPSEIVAMIAQVTKQVYPELSPIVQEEDWQTAYRHMCLAHRIFHDPTGLKRMATIGQIDPFVYKRHLPTVDILNEQKHTWYHPCNQEESFIYSVWELWEQASENTIDIYQQVWQLLDLERDVKNREEQYSALSTRLGNYSYDSGKPCEDGYQLQYAQPII